MFLNVLSICIWYSVYKNDFKCGDGDIFGDFIQLYML